MLNPGTIIRGYRVLSELGSGGMGCVYCAEHVVIGRRAAIKVLFREVSANEEVVNRFFMEAKAVNAIRHPNIVDITDFGRHEGLYFIIMELLEGETLGARLQRTGQMDEATTVRMVSQVASAVGAVNDRGMVHRDLKPENIFITNHPDYPDFVKVLDFGVIKLIGTDDNSAQRTRPGTIVGTPAYMSPEQCMGSAALDHRSDIYSLGVVAYQMLTGSTPFEGEAMEQIVAHANQLPPPAKDRNPDLSDEIAGAVMHALAKRPEDRFPNMRELRQAMEEAVGQARPQGGGTPGPLLGPPEPKARTVLPELAPPLARAVPQPTHERRGTPFGGVPTGMGLPRERRGTPAGGVPVSPVTAVFQPTPQEIERIERIERAQTKKVGGKMREIIGKRIAENRLKFPSMPAVALRCLDLMKDPKVKFSLVATELEKDPLLATRILKLVNSAAYGGVEKITSMQRAVSRLGLKPLKSVLVEMSAREVFSSRSPRVREAFRGIWEHCLAVGLLARDLAAALPSTVDPDTAYLAGLFHDLGKPLVASLLLEAERSLVEQIQVEVPFMTETLWLKVVNDCHRETGGALVDSWHLPEVVSKAISGLDSYEPDGGRGSCLNLIRYVNALAKREGIYVGAIDMEELVGVIGQGREILEVEDALEEEITSNLQRRVDALISATATDSGEKPKAAAKS